MKYFTLNFHFKKITPYSKTLTGKTRSRTPNNKTFRPNYFFSTKSEKFYSKH